MTALTLGEAAEALRAAFGKVAEVGRTDDGIRVAWRSAVLRVDVAPEAGRWWAWANSLPGVASPDPIAAFRAALDAAEADARRVLAAIEAVRGGE